eukprot:3833899-Ditylum_brightwellii.AAC.1
MDTPYNIVDNPYLCGATQNQEEYLNLEVEPAPSGFTFPPSFTPVGGENNRKGVDNNIEEAIRSVSALDGLEEGGKTVCFASSMDEICKKGGVVEYSSGNSHVFLSKVPFKSTTLNTTNSCHKTDNVPAQRCKAVVKVSSNTMWHCGDACPVQGFNTK